MEGGGGGRGGGDRVQDCGMILFVLRLNIQVNHSSVMSGRSQRFLGLTSTAGSLWNERTGI